MTLVGEFLDRTSLQLPRSSKTVALVYNIKQEASSNASPAISSSNLSLLSASHPQSPASDDAFAEWDTPDTINAVRLALEERYDVAMIEANDQAFEQLLRIRPRFVFNIAEGLHGVSREAQIPAMLEMLQIPYLGSDPQTLAISLDKGRTKEILSYHGIRTSPFTVVASPEEIGSAPRTFPLMVKPLHEGSSKGISNSCLVRNRAELEREVNAIIAAYREPALVEAFLPGREFTVAVLGNGSGARALPIVEIKFDALPEGVNPIYSFEAKWIWDTSDRPLEIFECPARLDPSLSAEIVSICLQTYRVLRCRDWSRIDVRLDREGKPNIIEVNPLPGILPKPEDNSCFPKAARAAGMSYSQLINSVLNTAMERHGLDPAEFAKSSLPPLGQSWQKNYA